MATSSTTTLQEKTHPDERPGSDRPACDSKTQGLPPATTPLPAPGKGGGLSSDEVEFHLDGVDNRERALPVRQGDLTRLLLAEPVLSSDDRARLAQFGRILGATVHSEFFEKLRELKELYAPLDPDSDYVSLHEHTLPRTDRSDEDFLDRFDVTLMRANYSLLPMEVIEEAVSAPNEMGLTYSPDFSLFDHLRIYVRGYTRIERECRNLATRFRKRLVSFDAYQRMVVALKFKPNKDLGPLVRDDVLYLRLFKDVPHVDMEMHLPEQGTKVRMRWVDKAQISSPLFTGIPAIVAKMVIAGAVSRTLLFGMIAAPVTAGIRSFLGYRSSKQKHLYSMIHRLYYLTMANNASVLTRIIDVAEDEEYKEAMLAYFFLWRGASDPQPWDAQRLDRRIESYLSEKTGISINFEIDDALHKLFRLGLARHDDQGHIEATPIDAALVALDRRWDAQFKYA